MCVLLVISGFRRDADEICPLLGYNAASSGDFLTLVDGTDTLSRNVGKGLPLDAALYPRRTQFSKMRVLVLSERVFVYI
jgi:hypothetical protein